MKKTIAAMALTLGTIAGIGLPSSGAGAAYPAGRQLPQLTLPAGIVKTDATAYVGRQLPRVTLPAGITVDCTPVILPASGQPVSRCP